MSSIVAHAWAQMLAERLNRIVPALGFEARKGVVFASRMELPPLEVVPTGGRRSQVQRQMDARGAQPAVYAANAFSSGALALLRERSASYVDSHTLHVDLQQPIVYLHDERPVAPPVNEAREGIRLSAAAGAVAIGLLEASDGIRVTDIADTVKVAPATAQKVIFALEAEGVLGVEGRGPNKRRYVLDRAGLLDRYADDARRDRREHMSLRVLSANSEERAREISRAFTSAGIEYAMTGVTAAAMEAPALTGQPRFEAWVSAGHATDYIVQSIDALPSDNSPNVILWFAKGRGPLTGIRQNPVTGMILASPFRVYADLLADPQRGREQAEVYREEVIGY